MIAVPLDRLAPRISQYPGGGSGEDAMGRILGYLALALAVIGLGLFGWDAFIERDSETNSAGLLIGLSALIAALLALRTPRGPGQAKP